MAFRAQYAQAAQFDYAFTQLDVGASAGHVGRNRNCAFASGHRNDISFTGMVLRIEDIVPDFALCEVFGKKFGSFDGNRADQDRLSGRVPFHDFIDQGIEFCLLCAVYGIGIVDSLDFLVCRNLDDVHVVDFEEFLFFRFRGTGHAGKLVVQTEIVLVCDGCQCGCLLLDGDAFLGFHCLMKAV